MGKWLGIIAALLLVMPGCGSDDTPTRPNNFTPLTSIVIEAGLNTLAHGTSTQLIAMGDYSGLFTRDISSQVIWSSEQPRIADFNFPESPGRVQAQNLSSGVATIRATAVEGITASIPLTVTVADIDSVTVTSSSPSLSLGLTLAFKAQGTFSDATTQDLTFDALWVSSVENFATVSNEVGKKGVVTGVNRGVTSISATFNGTSGEKSLEVTDPILLTIALSSVSSSLLSLSTQPFFATGKYSDGSSPDITTNVIWDSSNKSVAIFTPDVSLVKTLAQGTSTISATLGTVVGTTNLRVTGGTLTTIALDLNSAINNVLIKDTLSRITARGTFSNNTSRDITSAIATWAVVPSEIASVSPVGENPAWVTARVVTMTPATLSATNGSVTANSSLTVIAPTLSSLTIPEQTLTLFSGTSGRLSLSGTFSPASSQDLTSIAVWSTASPAIAIVGTVGLDKGRVHAVAVGTAVITAEYGGQTTTTTVTVEAGTLQSLAISAVTSPSPIIAGTEKKFKVEALYMVGANRFTRDVTADALWSMDKINVAKVFDPQSDPGLIVAVDTGSATLTAAFGGKTVTENIVVVAQ